MGSVASLRCSLYSALQASHDGARGWVALQELAAHAACRDDLLLNLFSQARVHYRSTTKSYVVTPSRRRICKPLLRKTYSSFASKTMKNSTTRKAMVNALGRMLQSEVAALCSCKSKSVLAQKPKDIGDFHSMISSLMDDMKASSPTLLSLLKWTLKTRTARANTDVIIAMITSIMCKHRKSSVCQFQRIISLILYTGHSSKQVIN